MKWTDERVAVLKELWGTVPAREIAARLSDEEAKFTKNSVIGKAHRLNLTPLVAPRKEEKPKPREPAKPKIRQPEEPPMMMPIICEPVTDGVTLMGLGLRSCRFPLGDPLRDDFRFCGQETPRLGVPYCHAHMGLAYVPKRDRKISVPSWR